MIGLIDPDDYATIIECVVNAAEAELMAATPAFEAGTILPKDVNWGYGIVLDGLVAHWTPVTPYGHWLKNRAQEIDEAYNNLIDLADRNTDS